MKRYDLTEDGYRHKFRKSRPEPAEKPDQLIHRLKNYLKKWMMFSKCDPKSAEEVTNMFLREQFFGSVHKRSGGTSKGEGDSEPRRPRERSRSLLDGAPTEVLHSVERSDQSTDYD